MRRCGRRWLRIAGLAIGMAGGMCAPAARAAGPACEYLLRSGKSYYENGDYVSAIHEFTKAVMVDPQNEEAQYYLRKLGIDGQYYARPRTQTMQVARLARKIDYYKRRIAALKASRERDKARLRRLKEQREDLRDAVAAERSENDRLRGEVEEVKHRAEEKEKESERRIAELKEGIRRRTREIALLTLDVQQWKGRVQEKEAEIARQGAEVARLKSDYETRMKEMSLDVTESRARLEEMRADAERRAREVRRLNNQLYAFKDKYRKRMKTLKAREAALREARRRLKTVEAEHRKDRVAMERRLAQAQEAVREGSRDVSLAKDVYMERITKLSEALRKERRRGDYLKDKLISVSYRLANREKQDLVRNQEMAVLKERLMKMERQLGVWRAKVEDLKSRQSRRSDRGDRDERERVAFIKRQDRLIADLKARLLATRRALAEAGDRPDLGAYEARIAALQSDLKRLTQALQDKELQLVQRTQAYSRLDDRLQDTRQRLDLVERVLEQKDRQIKELEKQLSEVMLRIDR